MIYSIVQFFLCLQCPCDTGNTPEFADKGIADGMQIPILVGHKVRQCQKIQHLMFQCPL